MSCQQIQQELLIFFGQQTLTDELQTHLDSCSMCQKFRKDLKSLTGNISSEEDFYLNEKAVEKMVTRIDDEIDRLEINKAVGSRTIWVSYLPAVAAMILLVGISFMAYMFDFFRLDKNQEAHFNKDSLLVSVDDNSTGELNENELEYILYEFATDKYENASELLLGDFTEEELQYLEKNFDVGDIL